VISSNKVYEYVQALLLSLRNALYCGVVGKSVNVLLVCVVFHSIRSSLNI
jgi:hypothetical protein